MKQLLAIALLAMSATFNIQGADTPTADVAVQCTNNSNEDVTIHINGMGATFHIKRGATVTSTQMRDEEKVIFLSIIGQRSENLITRSGPYRTTFGDLLRISVTTSNVNLKY